MSRRTKGDVSCVTLSSRAWQKRRRFLPCRRVTRTAHDSTLREHVRTLRRRRQLRRAVPLLPRQLHRQSACPPVTVRARRFENATPPDASSGADPRAHRRSRTPPLPQPQLENGDKGAPRPRRSRPRVFVDAKTRRARARPPRRAEILAFEVPCAFFARLTSPLSPFARARSPVETLVKLREQ